MKKLSTIIFFALVSVAIICSCSAFAAEPGAVSRQSYDAKLKSVVLYAHNAKILLTFREKNVVTVEVKAPEINSGFQTYMTVPGALKPAKPSVNNHTGTLRSGGVSVKFTKSPLSLAFSDSSGRELLRLGPGAFKFNKDGSWEIKFARNDSDEFYGLGEPQPGMLGEKKLPLNRGRENISIWNDHPQAYIGAPFFMNPKGYGLLVESPWRASFDFTAKDSFTYKSEGGPLRFHVFVSRSFYDILDALTQLAGRQPMPPKWVTGYMQSRSCYLDENYFRWRMDNFRSRRIPADALIFDNYWTQQNPDDTLAVGNLRWDTRNFPEPLAFQKEIHSLGFKTIVIIQPYVSQNALTYNDVVSRGLAATGDDGKPMTMCNGCYWKQPSVLLDFTNPATRGWFGRKVLDIRKTGVDAWWTDLTEPEWDSDEMLFSGGFRRNAVHNLQGLLFHKGLSDMYARELPDERLFILSRSSFTGGWRYGVSIWSGDTKATWFHLNDQIPIGISASLSGFGMWNSDVGGFSGMPATELFIRWMQFGAFCPVYRAHGDAIHEPWAYGADAEKINREFLELRYRLSPYLYTMFHEQTAQGRPPMRAMMLEFPGDPETRDINNQYMYGPWLLAAPVTKMGATSRKVYLPKGRWLDYWTGQAVSGPRWIKADAPIDRMPLFVREGAIIPMAPLMQYTGEKPADPLTLLINPGAAASSYTIYDDDGTSNSYLKGEFALTEAGLKPEPKGVTVNVSARKGGFKGMRPAQSYIIDCRGCSASAVLLDGKPLARGTSDVRSARPASASWSAGADGIAVYVPARRTGFSVRLER